MNLDNIKLVIWDLDETLWNGTISEGDVTINEEIVTFINNLINIGIMNSVCSKNDYEVVRKRLVQEGIWDYFIFPSINWAPKGIRVKQIISSIGLRPTNVVFIDDNIQNLKEAEFYLPDIHILHPKNLDQFILDAQNMKKSDTERIRLAQYKILEKKYNDEKYYNSNIEFLYSSNIWVDIVMDCNNYKDRIFDLMGRSNQLNYTKCRQNREDFEIMMSKPSIYKGVVTTKDNYGDYGIVGFFAIEGDNVIHFFFSCRILGMGVEQYVYMRLGCPDFEVRGEVASKLSKTKMPEWINKKKPIEGSIEKNGETNQYVLFKGPCDLLQIFSFIKKNRYIQTEFSYINHYGALIEGYNHTSQIVTALTCPIDIKERIVCEFEWFDNRMLKTEINNMRYSFVFLSLITDSSCAVYRHKETGYVISLCEKFYDLTNEELWEKYISGEIYGENIKFTLEDLKHFSEVYEYLPYSQYRTIENLEIILNYIDKNTKLVLMLGSETDCLKDARDSYALRAKEHKELNLEVEKWARTKKNVELFYYDSYINSQSDYVDSIDHYEKRVYYEVAKEIIHIIHEYDGDKKLEIRAKATIVVEKLISIIKGIAKKI